ncbi:MAG: hypothetical protein SF053_16025 [Bacteroidia bacterium]|nr:hypothetical protein [Bacteroidia bacterium]
MPDTPTPDQNLYFTLVFSLDEVNLIVQALGKRPFEEVYELIGNVNRQISAQLEPSSEQEPNQPPHA